MGMIFIRCCLFYLFSLILSIFISFRYNQSKFGVSSTSFSVIIYTSKLEQYICIVVYRLLPFIFYMIMQNENACYLHFKIQVQFMKDWGSHWIKVYISMQGLVISGLGLVYERLGLTLDYGLYFCGQLIGFSLCTTGIEIGENITTFH